MSLWFDIGVNLADKRLSEPNIISDASSAGVAFLAATGTDVEESIKAADIAADYPGYVFSTAGVHPHYAKDVSDHYLQDLAALAKRPQVLAIGECGLDFNRNFSPTDTQLRVFEQQLELAVELQLPVFLHEREAFDQQIALLKKYRSGLVGGVAHCFTGDIHQMQGYLELDLYVGITGWLCDPKRGESLRHAVQTLPLERVLLETDAPYLLPKTLKSKARTNVPANLPHIAEHLATLMDVDIAVLQQQALKNSFSLFQLNDEEGNGARRNH